MKLHKVNNKRNERVFKRLTESMSANTSISEVEDRESIEDIVGQTELSDERAVLNSMKRLLSLNPEGVKILYQQVVARKQEEEQMGDTVMVDAYNDILTKIPAYLASKEEWGMNFTETEKWLSGREGIEEVEDVVAEEHRDDAAIVSLLSQISQKLDGLEDIDTSIDYLIGAMSGETALSAKMKQSTLGRFADASPQLAELLKAKGLLE